MKKILVIMCTALSLSFLFTACGGDAAETTDDGWSAVYRP